MAAQKAQATRRRVAQEDIGKSAEVVQEAKDKKDIKVGYTSVEGIKAKGPASNKQAKEAAAKKLGAAASSG